MTLNRGTDPATTKARLPWLGIGQDSVTGYEAMTSGVAIVTTRSNEFSDVVAECVIGVLSVGGAQSRGNGRQLRVLRAVSGNATRLCCGVLPARAGGIRGQHTANLRKHYSFGLHVSRSDLALSAQKADR